jgi:hypothetical protein
MKSKKFSSTVLSCPVSPGLSLPAGPQVNLSANHLINSARLLSQRSQQQLLQALAPIGLQQTHPAGAADHAHAAALAGNQQQQQQQGVAAVGASNAAQQPAATTHAALEGHDGVQLQQQQQQLQAEAGATAVVTGDDYYAAKDRWACAAAVRRMHNAQCT